MLPPHLHPVKHPVPLTNKHVIAQFGIVLCYFLLSHVTGHALPPPQGEGIVAPPRPSPLPAGERD